MTGIHLSEEWMNCQVSASGGKLENQLSSLQSKIKKHHKSCAHDLCREVMDKRNCKVIEEFMLKMSAGLDRATVNIFRTAYHIAKSNRPFTEHEPLLELLILNSVDTGTILYS